MEVQGRMLLRVLDAIASTDAGIWCSGFARADIGHLTCAAQIKYRQDNKIDHTVIVTLEQIAPFPFDRQAPVPSSLFLPLSSICDLRVGFSMMLPSPSRRVWRARLTGPSGGCAQNPKLLQGVPQRGVRVGAGGAAEHGRVVLR
eukprot:767649-Rhodomonas_salina.1